MPSAGGYTYVDFTDIKLQVFKHSKSRGIPEYRFDSLWRKWLLTKGPRLSHECRS